MGSVYSICEPATKSDNNADSDSSSDSDSDSSSDSTSDSASDLDTDYCISDDICYWKINDLYLCSCIFCSYSIRGLNSELKKKAKLESKICVVCMDKPIQMVITKCGHMVLCSECCAKLDKCPVCRTVFAPNQVIKVFTA